MNNKQKIILVMFLVVISVLGRFIPHLWNMTPVGALSVLLTSKLGILYSIPFLLATLAVSDFFLGSYMLPIMITVYISFGLYVAIAFLLRKKGFNFTVFGTFVSSFLFFVITNFAVWYFGTMYPHNLEGLVSSYFMALPFFVNQVLGDLFFVSAGFLVWDLSVKAFSLNKKISVSELAK
jgi:hypothetical protein